MGIKTEKIVVFRKHVGLRDNESWIYKNTPIEVVNEFNYLCMVFKYTGSFVLNQETLVCKGLKALNCLFYNTKIIHFLQTLCASCSMLLLILFLITQARFGDLGNQKN